MNLSRVHVVLFASVTVSLVLVGVTVFGRTLDEWLTPFIMAPLVLGVWLVFLGVAGWSLWTARRIKLEGWKTLLPLGACTLPLAALILVPFEQMQIKADFAAKRTAREAVVQRVEDGSLGVRESVPYAGYPVAVGLGRGAPALSAGGNEIITEEYNGRVYVMFYFYRGILGSFSAYLHVPPGGSLKEYREFGSGTIDQRLDRNWYFVRGD